MRTSEERVDELHRRMKQRREERNGWCAGVRLTSAAVFALCFLLTVSAAFWISVLSPETTGSASGAAASIFADHGILGYAVIAIVAFCLGTEATLLCFRLKRRYGEKDDDRKP